MIHFNYTKKDGEKHFNFFYTMTEAVKFMVFLDKRGLKYTWRVD